MCRSPASIAPPRTTVHIPEPNPFTTPTIWLRSLMANGSADDAQEGLVSSRIPSVAVQSTGRPSQRPTMMPASLMSAASLAPAQPLGQVDRSTTGPWPGRARRGAPGSRRPLAPADDVAGLVRALRPALVAAQAAEGTGSASGAGHATAWTIPTGAQAMPTTSR